MTRNLRLPGTPKLRPLLGPQWAELANYIVPKGLKSERISNHVKRFLGKISWMIERHSQILVQEKQHDCLKCKKRKKMYKTNHSNFFWKVSGLGIFPWYDSTNNYLLECRQGNIVLKLIISSYRYDESYKGAFTFYVNNFWGIFDPSFPLCRQLIYWGLCASVDI